MPNLNVRLLSALEKVLPTKEIAGEEIRTLFGFSNESVSFQLAFTSTDLWYDDDYYLIMDIDSPIKDHIQIYSVSLSPCAYPAIQNSDDNYLTKDPGMIPDLLTAYKHTPIRLKHFYWQTFWIEIMPSSFVGSAPITLQLKNRQGDVLWDKTITLEVASLPLPKQTLKHTEWFHCDCICQQYGCTMFSDEFFSISKNYWKYAVNHGINTLLTPVFTPSLDIEEGCKRLPSQLVGVTVEKGQYFFDFSLLNKWIKEAQDCGITHFEIMPFLTQWGAKYAIEIYGTVDGEYQAIMGWDTPASDQRYGEFLALFLPQLMDVLKFHNLSSSQVFFHVSDEPVLEHIETYKSARNMIHPYIEDCAIIDALSDYSFYEKGLVDCPVVANDHIQGFIDHKASNLWTYYCGAQGNKVSNRFIAMPSYRNRILGIQLYMYEIQGFLHWGYNFWNSVLSKESINPYLSTDAKLGYPAGDPFLVYPGEDGMPVPSIRLKVLRDALQDLRALQLLESLSSREETLSLIKEVAKMDITFTEYPHCKQSLLDIRSAVNKKIMLLYKKKGL